MKLHPNYIKELKEKYKDQEYTGSDWENAFSFSLAFIILWIIPVIFKEK